MVQLFDELLLMRLRSLGFIVSYEVVGALVELVWPGNHHHLARGDAAGMFAMVTAIVALIVIGVLAYHAERLWTSTYFRLLPLTTWRLVGVNWLTNAAVWLVFLLGHGVVLVGLAECFGSPITHSTVTWATFCLGIGIAFAATSFAWCLISLVNLGSQAIAASFNRRSMLVRLLAVGGLTAVLALLWHKGAALLFTVHSSRMVRIELTQDGLMQASVAGMQQTLIVFIVLSLGVAAINGILLKRVAPRARK